MAEQNGLPTLSQRMQQSKPLKFIGLTTNHGAAAKLPQNWKVYYKDATGNWQPVVSPDAYPILKGTECTVNFEPVKTSALKLEIKLPDKPSSGLFEWSVK